MAQQQQHDQPSSSRSDDDEIVLVARSPAWALPTACPACLPSFIYLKLANVAFAIHYNDRLPDSDDLPFIEYGDMVGFSDETGGIVEFLKSQSIEHLDAAFSEEEVAELRSHSAMVTSWLQEAVLHELWENENQKVVRQIYFSALPWPIDKFLNWKQQMVVNQKLGINTVNKENKVAELYRKAAEAYEALSIILGEQRFFMKTRPSSLDALFLGHALFILQAPLENSQLKEEFLKHTNLVRYAESLRKEFLEDSGSIPISRSVHSTSKRTASSSSKTSPASSARSRNAKEKEPKERSDKDKLLRRRAKYFIAAQIAAVIVYVVVVGIAFDEAALEEEGGDED